MTNGERDLGGLERVLKACANKRRLGILRHLKKAKESAVGDIAHAIKLSFKATSKHLAILNAAGLVEREQRNVQMFYTLSKNLPAPAHSIITLL
ncbi:MAG: hypothetical protein JWM46_189 [Candidatus Kaiserbacteria bacterium]|nr:hypothetical protein [Candidatus Kaiserbacteria bacterium]